MEVWHGRIEWSSGRKGRMRNFRWLSIKDKMRMEMLVGMDQMILICLSKKLFKILSCPLAKLLYNSPP